MPATDFLAVIHALSEHCVDFIVVGGVAAVLEGAPISTFDLDIVDSRAIDNVQRLEGALTALDAHYRSQPDRQIRLQASHLLSEGHQLLMTRYGPLDILGAIGYAHGYEELFEHVNEIQAGPGNRIRVLKLERLIEVKSETAGEKDFATLPILRKTLEEKGRR
jgi:predicted nucleotidyltransferase